MLDLRRVNYMIALGINFEGYYIKQEIPPVW